MAIKQKMVTFTEYFSLMKLWVFIIGFGVFNLGTSFAYAASNCSDAVNKSIGQSQADFVAQQAYFALHPKLLQKAINTENTPAKAKKEHLLGQSAKTTAFAVQGNAILKQLNDTLHRDVSLYVPLLRLNTETPTVVTAATQTLTLRKLTALQQQLNQLSLQVSTLTAELLKADVLHKVTQAHLSTVHIKASDTTSQASTSSGSTRDVDRE